MGNWLKTGRCNQCRGLFQPKNGEGFWKRTEVVLGKLAVPGYNGNLELEAKPLVAGYFFTTVVLLAPLLNIYQQKCRNE